LENPRSVSELTTGGLNCRIDALAVVRKEGKIPASSLPAVRQVLTSSGMTVVGVIENFVHNI
jgi:hypothetical protein